MPVKPISPDALRRANNARVLENLRRNQNSWGAKTPFDMMKSRQKVGAVGIRVQRPGQIVNQKMTTQNNRPQRMTMVHQKPPAPKKGFIEKLLGK